MWGITPVHLIILLVIVLIIVGPGKLPDTGAAIGKALRGFKDAMDGNDKSDAAAPQPPAQPPVQPPVQPGQPPVQYVQYVQVPPPPGTPIYQAPPVAVPTAPPPAEPPAEPPAQG